MTGSPTTFSPALNTALDALMESTIEFCATLAEIQKQGVTDPIYLQACDDIAAVIRAQKAANLARAATPAWCWLTEPTTGAPIQEE